ncbi:hypothetical protein [Coraliomargarita parva]|uniref:hypothetical protein n=1 Tax=Coraliomargarita parva TaxID=3014050 RepID=UPI0022B40E7E|nr:hypothetical protein [Coraliomargarita parva]
MSITYDPPKNHIGTILTSARFQKIYADVTKQYPSETVNSRARWAFILFMGWSGSFFGIKYGPTYAERFTLPGFSIAQKNAVDYAASQITAQPGNHAPIEDGPDLIFDIIPDAASAAVDGALDGLDNIKTVLKWGIPIALLLYLSPQLIKAYKAATE